MRPEMTRSLTVGDVYVKCIYLINLCIQHMKIDLDDLTAFIAVAELGGFSKAAEHMNLSQPALSRRVLKLEETLGVALLERTTPRVEPSAERAGGTRA